MGTDDRVTPARLETDEERIEFVRAAIDAFNRRDADGMRELAGEDFEYDWTRSMGPHRGVYKGPDGFLEFINDPWEMFDPFVLAIEDIIPRGNNVVVPTTIRGRGPQDVPVSASSTHLYTFEDGRLVRITMFQEREEALAAAG
jgi:ketosteroid isomerase-like protein